MGDLIQDSKAFQSKFKFDEEEFDQQKLWFRMALLTEEYQETLTAAYDGNAEEWVDGHIDLLVIVLGNLNLAGVDIQRAWDAVHTANMTKERGVKPGRENSGGFDVIKPKGWKAPSHKGNHGKVADIFKNTRQPEKPKA